MNTIFSLPIKLKLFRTIKTKNITRKNKVNTWVLPRLKKESVLKINTKIDFCIFKNTPRTKFYFETKDLYSISLLTYVTHKNKLLNFFGFKKQYFYLMCHIFLALSRAQNDLISHEIFSFFERNIVAYKNTFKVINRVLFGSIFGSIFNQTKKQVYFEIIWAKIFKNFNNIFIKQFFVYFSNIISKTKPLFFNIAINVQPFTLEKVLNFQNILQVFLLKSKINFQYFLRHKQIFNLLNGHISNWTLNNLEINFLFYQRLLLLNKKQNLNFLSKQGSFKLRKLLHFNIKSNSIKKGNSFSYKEEISPSFLYYITKLREKHKLFSSNVEKQKEILGLRNFFLTKGYQKFRNKLSLGLFPQKELFTFYKKNKKPIFSRALNFYFSSTKKENFRFKNKNMFLNPRGLKKKIQVINFTNKLNLLYFLKAKKTINTFLNKKKYNIVNTCFWNQKNKTSKVSFVQKNLKEKLIAGKNRYFSKSKLSFQPKIHTSFNFASIFSTQNKVIDNLEQKKRKLLIKKKTFIAFQKRQQILRDKKKALLQQKVLWKQKKLTVARPTIWFKNLSNYFSAFLGQNVNLIFINALGIAKFGFTFQNRKKKNNAQRFLNQIQRQMIQRYKYIAIYIQDFIRICFFSFFFKNPTFLTNFMGFQLAKLPKNRKETKFIRFLIKAIKIFAAHRREIFAVKVAFKGRVNRWRRTKVIRGQSGIISFITYNTRIEYGSGKAITRKGAIGIHLWICYKVVFIPILRATLLGYIEYSQQIKAKTIHRVLHQFQLNTKHTLN